MLSPEQIEHFRMQGHLVLDPCLEAGQVEALTERVRQIAEGEIDTRFMISHRLPLEQAAKGYHNFRFDQNDWTKVVLKPGMQAAA